MRLADIAVFAALVACNRDHPTEPFPDGMLGDSSTRVVTGRGVVRDVINTATRSPVVVEDVSPQSLEVIRLDGIDGAEPVAVAADGTFQFEATGPWRASVAFDGGAAVEYQLAGDRLDLAQPIAGRYERAAVPAGTTLNVSVTGAPGGGTAMVATTGLWTQTFRSGGSNGNFTIDWTNAGTLSGAASLLDAAKYDRVYYATVEAAGSSPQYQTLTSSCTSDITMTGGSANPLTCGAMPLALDRCVHLVAHEAAETTRIGNASVGTPALPNYSAYWIAFAMPAPTLGPVGALWLAYHIPAPSTTQPADVDREIKFGNPYPGHDIGAVMVAQKYRTFALGTAAATTLGAVTVHYVKAQADCTTPTEIPQSVEIPTVASIDGIRLGNDAMSLGLDRTRLHTITFDIAAPGDADYYSVRLIEVGVSAANATTLTIRRVYITTERKVLLDPDLLEVGKTYVIDTEAVVAHPDATSGDFRTWGFPAAPYALSSVMSAAFRIDE